MNTNPDETKLALWLDDELHPIWDWALEVADQSGYGHRANVSARNGAGFGEADMRRIRGEQFAKRRAGRIVRDVDALQERLGEELLLGQLVELDGEVYRVGGFQGDKVELWRESRAGHTPNAESEIEYPIWGIPPGKTEEDLLYTRARTMEEAKRVCRILETEHGVTRPRIQVLNLTEPPDFSNVLAGRRHRSNGAPGLTATDLRKMRVGDEVNVPCGPAGENLFIKRTKRDEFFIRIPGHEHARWGTAQQAADDIEQFVQYGALPRSSGARMF